MPVDPEQPQPHLQHSTRSSAGNATVGKSGLQPSEDELEDELEDEELVDEDEDELLELDELLDEEELDEEELEEEELDEELLEEEDVSSSNSWGKDVIMTPCQSA
jgi:hypothetical protein